MKKILTFKNKKHYTGNLKTSNTVIAPVRFCDFFVFAKRRMRAENIQYQPKLVFEAFSESATFHNLCGNLRKVKHMKNTKSETTIQTLYRYYSEMRDTWYIGDYSLEQEAVYGKVFSALQDAIMRLPAQGEADRKIKCRYLKEIIELENNTGKANTGIVEIINSLAAE